MCTIILTIVRNSSIATCWVGVWTTVTSYRRYIFIKLILEIKRKKKTICAQLMWSGNKYAASSTDRRYLYINVRGALPWIVVVQSHHPSGWHWMLAPASPVPLCGRLMGEKAQHWSSSFSSRCWTATSWRQDIHSETCLNECSKKKKNLKVAHLFWTSWICDSVSVRP